MASVSPFMAASGTFEPPELPTSLPPPALNAAVFVRSASVCKWNMMIGNSPELMDLGAKLKAQNARVPTTAAAVPASESDSPPT